MKRWPIEQLHDAITAWTAEHGRRPRMITIPWAFWDMELMCNEPHATRRIVIATDQEYARNGCLGMFEGIAIYAEESSMQFTPEAR